MEKPSLILKQYLVMPIIATEARVAEILEEIKKPQSDVALNGLFLMLVSYIESMKKEILIYFLKYHPEKIDTNTIEVDKTLLTKLDDFNLLERFITDYVERIPYWKLKKLFYSVLEIEKPQNKSEIERIVNKRNELIHKNLEMNYKLGVAGKASVPIEYLSDSINQYMKFISYLKSSISITYNQYTKINALKNLWYYTFETSLCANFSEYWGIDEEKDTIVSCKYPKIANELSKIEIFMLQVWRSQVCGANLDFPFMISIDRHFQKCFFMFLRLSMDISLYQEAILMK